MEGIQPGAGVWTQTLSVDRQLAEAGEQAKRKYPRRVELWVGVEGERWVECQAGHSGVGIMVLSGREERR